MGGLELEAVFSYDCLLGHEYVERFFARVIEGGKVGHAYLFFGPRGVGKKTFAFYLAQWLLCRDSSREGPCLECVSCQKVQHNNHPDISFFSPAEDRLWIPLEAVMQIQREVSYAPLEGGYRIAIVDEVERMNEEAANAFLKTLEEPQGNAIFILLAENIYSLKDTIVSRVQKVRFAPLSLERVWGYCRREFSEEGVLDGVVYSSMGSLERVRQFMDSGWLERRDWLLGMLEGEEFRFSSGFVEGILGQLESFSKRQARRKELVETLELLETLFRDLGVLSSCSRGILFHPDRRDRLEEISRKCSFVEWFHLFHLCWQTRQKLAYNLHLELTLENFAIEFQQEWGLS
ncbi:MAG: DNA polymerase III subunit delta' [Planctomycetota bacterium]|nr:MAG: DNA polymerase III subunit delta' [Planctomycetota bacterium]